MRERYYYGGGKLWEAENRKLSDASMSLLIQNLLSSEFRSHVQLWMRPLDGFSSSQMTASLTNFISTSGVIKECKLQNALFSVQSTEIPLFLLPFFEMRNFRKPYLAPPFVICLCIQSTIFLHSNTTTRKWLMVFWLTGKWSWQQIGLSGQSVSFFPREALDGGV